MKKLFTLLAIVIGFTVVAQPAGWLYNQPITVQNPNAQAAVDYQLKITVNTASLISAGKMTATGSDIRFAGACTSNAFFNYWIEGGINTATTAIWVKIPLIAANTNTVIYMFFGNPGAIATSTIPGTFRGPNSSTDSVFGGASGGMLICQRGFRFQPTQNLLVTHFGKNEPSGTTRYVTLFNYSTQAILSQTTVSGPSATYTYGPISSPLWLSPTTQYVLQVYGIATDGYYFGSSSQIGQHLTYFEMQYSNGGTQNTFPNSTLTGYHYGYGDFLYYITNTLAITPTYTLGGGTVSITGPSSMCSGNSITLTTNATGTYSWNTGSTASLIVVSPVSNTTYSVSQTSTTGCNAVALISVTVNAGVPVLSISSSTNQTCLGKTATLTASGALTYTWSNGVINGQSFFPTGTTTYTVIGQNGCGTSNAVTTITVSPLPVTVLSSPTLICVGSTATLTAAGPATTYTWTPLNLSGGNVIVSPTTTTIFSVAASDGTCAGSATVVLAVNPIPTLAIVSSASLVCEGYPVTLTASGALTYTWSPIVANGSTITANPSGPTLYSVSGSNSLGCVSSANQAILTTPSPTLNISATSTVACVGGTVSLSASGANTYSWNSGPTTQVIVVSPIVSTVYTVVGTFTNGGCTTIKSVSISVFTKTIGISGPSVCCQGTSLNYIASGANTYTWNTGASGNNISVSPATSTVYLVSGTSPTLGMNCLSTQSIAVTVNPNPSVSIAATRTTMCKGEKNTLTANGASNYLWNTASTSNTLLLNPTAASTIVYSVTGTDANGCESTASISMKVNACTGIELQNAGVVSGISVYPNPNNGEFTISADSEWHLVMVNEIGQLVRDIYLNDKNNFKMDITNLSKGIYFINGEKDSMSIHQKISVNK